MYRCHVPMGVGYQSGLSLVVYFTTTANADALKQHEGITWNCYAKVLLEFQEYGVLYRDILKIGYMLHLLLHTVSLVKGLPTYIMVCDSTLKLPMA